MGTGQRHLDYQYEQMEVEREDAKKEEKWVIWV